MHRAASVWLLAASLLLIACPAVESPTAPQAPPLATLAFVAGNIRVASSTVPATALAINGDRILAIGSDAAISTWIGPKTKVVDLRGRTLMPGFVDGHMDLVKLGTRRFGINLVGTQSVEDVQSRIARAVAATPPGTWILGQGWDQNDWTQARPRRFPSAELLDEVAKEHPVALMRIDNQAVWANSKAMELAEIPRGSRTLADKRTISSERAPSGIFVDDAMALIQRAIPRLQGPALVKAIELAERDGLAAGLVSIHAMDVTPNDVVALRDLERQGKLQIRIHAYYDGNLENLSEVLKAGPQPASSGSGQLSVRGVHFSLDDSLLNRAAWLMSPYSDNRKALTGSQLIEPSLYEARVKTAVEAGFQVATTAHGDQAVRHTLDVYQRVFGRNAYLARPRIEQVDVVDPTDFGRFASEGVLVTIQPTRLVNAIPWIKRRIGATRMKHAFAWKTLLTRSTTVAIGSGAPEEDLSPFLGLYAAISRKDLFGSPSAGFYPEERLTPDQALTANVQGGLWAAFEEKETGRIEPGLFADLVVVDVDPLKTPAEELVAGQVYLTVARGQLVYIRPGADAPPAPPPPPSPPPVRAPEPVKTSTVPPVNKPTAEAAPLQGFRATE
jgi:predicted amidohydrolase YtcJ